MRFAAKAQTSLMRRYSSSRCHLREKGLDCCPPLEELRTISPPAVFRVCERDARGVAAVPCVLGEAGLLRGSFDVERRQGRAVYGFSFADAGERYLARCLTTGKSMSVLATLFT